MREDNPRGMIYVERLREVSEAQASEARRDLKP